MSCFAIAFGDAAVTNNNAVAQNVPDTRPSSTAKGIGSVVESLKFDEFWHRILSILQDHDGFVEKEDLERALGIRMQDTDHSTLGGRFALTDAPGKLRVEWSLYPYTTPAARGAHPGATAMSNVEIHWYGDTFEAFDVDAANELTKKDLRESGFFWIPPQPHSHGGVSPAYFLKLHGGRYPPSVEFDLKRDARWPYGRYAIRFTGTARAEPAK